MTSQPDQSMINSGFPREQAPYARYGVTGADQELEPVTELDDASDADSQHADAGQAGQLSTSPDDLADRDIVIVAAGDSLVAEDLDDDLEGDDLEGDDLAAVDLTDDDLTADDLTDGELADGEVAASDDDVAVAARHEVPPAGARPDNGDVSREWHDIQAMFVDDPRGSVQLAAAAADAAVDALMAALHQRQAALTPADAAHDSSETEQLREALRSYRIFCQEVADLGQHLTEPATMAG